MGALHPERLPKGLWHPCLCGIWESVPPVDSGCCWVPCPLGRGASSVPHSLGFWKHTVKRLICLLFQATQIEPTFKTKEAGSPQDHIRQSTAMGNGLPVSPRSPGLLLLLAF